MSDYKINLPQTKFPMKANLPENEPKMLEFWEKINLQQKILETTVQRKNKFLLHDGPPYANGEIHIGHAFNKIFKDMVNKVNFMAGYATPYVPGWDCHGLPIELNIEKKFGKAGDKISVTDFINASRHYAESQIQTQAQDFKRLGVLGDWQHPYKTMDFKYEADTIRALAKIIENGYLQRGHKPVHWCIACRSALAEAEVEYKDKTSPAIDVRFHVVAPQKLAIEGHSLHNLNIPIWTTTPWTLPANEAVALHPELIYVLVHCPAASERAEEYLILLEDLVATAMQRYGITVYTIIKKYSGKELFAAGIELQHPFLDKQVPIILGEHVTTDTGTGAVHTAPAHGAEDYVAGKQYHLPVQNPVGSDGKFFANTPYFGGQDVFAANSEVIKLLQERGNLLAYTTLQHSYPHCWRHKTPLIFRATPQWFVSLDTYGAIDANKTLRQMALAVVDQVNWLYAHGKERIKNMIEQRPDWCVSRQRTWGSPMTLFVHKQTGELHPQIIQLMATIASEIEKQGIIFWQHLGAQEFLTAHSNATLYHPTDYEKVSDTLDVWFDSGVSHFCVLQQRPELGYPADLYIEGSDQYRGWFQSSLLTAVAINGTAPYRSVISHGFTVDGTGHKMSKSVGNVISPQKLIKNSGADILRLWVASTFPYDDMSISDEIIKSNADAYRKLRNTARYLLGNLYDFNPQQHKLPINEMLALDRWAISEIIKLQKEVDESNNHDAPMHAANSHASKDNLFKFYNSCAKIQYAASVTLSSFYFSIIKDRLYTMPENSRGRRSAQTALYHILEVYVRLLAPFISFTAEEIWQTMRQLFADNNMEYAESVFLSAPYKLQLPSLDPFTAAEWESVQQIYTAVYKELEKLRAAGKIGSNLEADVILYCDEKNYNLLNKFAPINAGDGVQNLESELRFLLITSSATIASQQEKSAGAVVAENLDGLWIYVERSSHPKCARCWHLRVDVGHNYAYPELCDRCATNLQDENGELRQLV